MKAKHTPGQFTLFEDELQVLVTYHMKRMAFLLGKADNAREYAPDVTAAQIEAASRSDAQAHRLRADEFAAAIAKATGSTT